jgi:hypothetical protein
MSKLTRRQSLWRTFPIVGIFLWEWEVWRKSQSQPCYQLVPKPKDTTELQPFPIDMRPLLDLPNGPLDEAGVPYFIPSGEECVTAGYHPTYVAQYALVRWNEYLRTKDEKHLQAFLTQARWFVEHERRIGDDAGGWPLPFPNHEFYAPKSWLSALTQGEGVAIVVRAYRVTGEDTFLQVARRAVRTFEMDISDGGVCSTIGENGLFFEEVAVCPAAHILNGYILGLFGLYDYIALTNDRHVAERVQRSLDTLHTIIDDFDLGYGSRYDLLLRRPASRFYHALHVILLKALAQYSDCEYCAAVAIRWASYQHGIKPLINHLMSRIARYRLGL